MSFVTLQNQEIPYTITFKKNKNTYFRFLHNGTIQINASKRQSLSDIIKYMELHDKVFLLKRSKVMNIPKKNSDIYLFWGKEYHVILVENATDILFAENQVLLPINIVDQKNSVLAKFEKAQMLEYINQLHQEYINNPYIKLQNVKYKTNYTTSRHGSCNAKTRIIHINTNLIHYDKQFTKYVYLHEICHLNEQNHQAPFYDLLAKLLPNHKTLKQQLKQIYHN